MLEEHINTTLTLPIEDQPAEYLGDQAPVLTAAIAAFAAGAALVTGAYAAGKAAG